MTLAVPAAIRAGRTLAAGIALTTLSVLLPYLLGTLADGVQATLGFGDRGIGYAIAGFWLVSAVSAPRLGLVVDRLGWRAAGVTGAAGAGTGLLLVGLGGHLLPVLLIGLLIGGFAHGLASPSSHVAVNAAFPPERRGAIFGVKQSAPPAATALAGLAVPAVAVAWGWQRAVLLAVLLAPVASVLIACATVRPRRAEGGGAGSSRPVGRLVSAGAPARQRPAGVPLAGSARQLRWLAIAGGSAATGLGAVTAFATRTLQEAGVPVGTAGAVVMLASAAAIAVKVGAGRWLDRHAGRAFAATGWLLAIGAGGMAAMATGRAPVVVVGTVVAFAGIFGWDGVFLAGVIDAHSARPGWATGRLQLPMAGGTALGPIAFGVLASTSGYAAAWIVFAVVSVGAAAAAAAAHRCAVTP